LGQQQKLTIRENLRDSDIPSYRIQTIGNLNWKKWATILLPLPQRTALSLSFPGIQRVRTLTYAHVGRQKLTKLKMDVFKHTNTASNAPIFLYIHGGGWITGHRRTPPFPLVYQVASHGWVVCVIDYRLSPKVRFPTHLKDCKRAIVWLKLHAKIQLDANGDFIVVGGESAGGHLSSLIALTANHKEFQPGFEDIDTSVRGCIDAYGVHDMTDRHGIYFARDENYHFTKFIEMFLMQKKIKGAEEEFEIASPISYLDPKCPPCDSDSPSTKKQKTKKMVPPFLIAHGTSDTLVLFQDSSFFYQELLQYRERHGQHQVKDIFLPIHDAHHAFNYLISPRTIAFGDAICTFMDNLHDKTKHLTIDEIAAAMIQNRSSATFSSLAVVQKQIVPSKL
jgi:acetyl esterase/lipase